MSVYYISFTINDPYTKMTFTNNLVLIGMQIQKNLKKDKYPTILCKPVHHWHYMKFFNEYEIQK